LACELDGGGCDRAPDPTPPVLIERHYMVNLARSPAMVNGGCRDSLVVEVPDQVLAGSRRVQPQRGP